MKIVLTLPLSKALNAQVGPTRSDCGCTGQLPGVNVVQQGVFCLLNLHSAKISFSHEFTLHFVNLLHNEQKLQWQTEGPKLMTAPQPRQHTVCSSEDLAQVALKPKPERERTVKNADTLRLAGPPSASSSLSVFLCPWTVTFHCHSSSLSKSFFI